MRTGGVGNITLENCTLHLQSSTMATTPAPFLSLLTTTPIYIPLFASLLLIAAFALFRPRRSKASSTPPRSVSPSPADKKPLLPVQRRNSLVSLLSNVIPGARRSPPATPSAEVPVTNRTPAEIAAYGNFPDYATLSGVPLPKAYPELDIAKALPRPYRPFRWAYHQTMCSYHHSFL